jgi:hypothetical protein
MFFAMVRFLRIQFLFCVVLSTLVACGQDTPIGVETPSAAGTPLVISGRPTITPRADIPVTRDPVADVPLPACTPPLEQVIPIPENFPSFPFPPGTKITNFWMLNNDPNSLQVLGYAPMGLFEGLTYLIKELPKQGYDLGYGDQESNEAESQFSGNGWRGAFVLRGIYECEGVSLWRVVMLKQ